MNKEIRALFDSVTTIDKIINGQETPGVDSKLAVSMNIEAIDRGLNTPDTRQQLTLGQITELEAGIARGRAFL
jgi:hypothetical protein